MDNLLYFDFYATKPSLFIKKQDSFRTYLGSILSLITIIVLVLILIFVIFCFMNDTGLNVLNEKNTNGLNSLDLNLSKKLFFYYLNDKDGQKIDKRYIRTYPFLTTVSASGTQYELLKEVKCDITELIHSDLEYKYLLDFDISEYNCIKTYNDSDAIIRNSKTPYMNSYIILYIAKCQNDTKVNITDCFPEEKINEFIENNNIFINFFLESASIDHHNYSHPLKKGYYHNSLSILKDFIFSYSFFWRKIEYYTRNSLLLFNYLFYNSSFILDTTINNKDIYSTNTRFYIEKTIGKIEFLITVDYIDSYVRNYKTLIDSLTLFMTGFHIIINICKLINYIFTKSYIYCTIFEPIISNSKIITKNDNFIINSSIKNIKFLPNNSSISISPSHSSSKNQLIYNKNNNQNKQLLKLNNKTFPTKQNPSFLNSSEFDQMKTCERKKFEELKKILTDIQSKKISDKINISDNFVFFFFKNISFEK